MRVSLLAVVGVVFALTATMGAAPAHANSKYAALVIHAETGDILFDKYSTQRRYPASLTKLMTLYLLFEALEAGTLDLDDKLTASSRAAGQPASRLGLTRGQKITVEDAINALVIRSANDVATVVAERLGGTESAFARQMTSKARRMGMRRTTFRNASGLPDRRQVTTARDMAVLAMRISQDFPQYFHYFDRSSFKWGGRTYRTHNRVAQTLRGADGLKTGYTRASGYNLTTTVTRGEHKLIGVVLGGRSGATRDRHMVDIIERSFRKIKARPTMLAAAHRLRPTPTLRPGRAPGQVPKRDDVPFVLASVADTAPASRLSRADNGKIVPTPLPKALIVAFNQRDLGEQLLAGGPAVTFDGTAGNADERTVMAAMSAADPGFDIAALRGTLDQASARLTEEAQGDALPDTERAWFVQVGAFRQETQALARIEEVQNVVRSIAMIPNREVRVAQRGEATLYRAQFTRLTEAEALDTCSTLREMGDECIALNVAR